LRKERVQKTDIIPQFWGSPGHKLNFNPNFKMFTNCWMNAECKTYIVFCLILQHSAQAMQFHENFNLANLYETQSFINIQKLELKLQKKRADIARRHYLRCYISNFKWIRPVITEVRRLPQAQLIKSCQILTHTQPRNPIFIYYKEAYKWYNNYIFNFFISQHLFSKRKQIAKVSSAKKI
jgi:hypothetical protein